VTALLMLSTRQKQINISANPLFYQKDVMFSLGHYVVCRSEIFSDAPFTVASHADVLRFEACHP